MKLPYALEMVKGIRPGKIVADPIGRLHRLHVDVREPMPEMARIWAIETADYPPLYSRPPSESPKKATFQLNIMMTATRCCLIASSGEKGCPRHPLWNFRQ
jgi:hypothetical protein